MIKNDARKLNLAQLHERRKEVVRLHREGHAVMKIVRMTGMSWPAVRSAIDLYESGGTDAIKPAVRGRRDGDGRSLTEQQESLMRELICTQRPDQLGLSERMWSRSSVDELIQRECGVKLSERAVGNYVNRWGFTAAAPLPQQPKLDDERLVEWLRKDYPALVQRARTQQAEIQWLQTGVLHGGAIKEPDSKTTRTVERLSQHRHVLIAVSNQRKTRWLVSSGMPDDQQWAHFLDALTADVGSSILIQTLRSRSAAATLAPSAALFNTRPIACLVAGEATVSTLDDAPVSEIEFSAAASAVDVRERGQRMVLDGSSAGEVEQKAAIAVFTHDAGNDAIADRAIALGNDRSHPSTMESAPSRIRAPLDRSLQESINRIRAIAAVAVVAALAAIAAVGVAAVVVTSSPDTLPENESGHIPAAINVRAVASDYRAGHLSHRTIDFTSSR